MQFASCMRDRIKVSTTWVCLCLVHTGHPLCPIGHQRPDAKAQSSNALPQSYCVSLAACFFSVLAVREVFRNSEAL